jgi:hypothetical protein
MGSFITAKLVQDKTRIGFRAIVQHEKSHNSFYPVFPNVGEWVCVCEATQEDIRPILYLILSQLGLKDFKIEDTTLLAEKFYKEIVTFPLVNGDTKGSLAYNETGTKEKFFLIINSINE